MGANACKQAYDADPQACLTGAQTQCLRNDGPDGACSCYIFRNTSGASRYGFADSCGYLPLEGDGDFYGATPTAGRVSANGRFVSNGGDSVDSFQADPGCGTYGQMMNLGGNSGTWTSTCEAFAVDLLDRGLDDDHHNNVYCYTQTGALGFGFVSEQYARPCKDCKEESTKDNDTPTGFLDDTLVGQLLEGASEEVAEALKNVTVGTGADREASDLETYAGLGVDLGVLVTAVAKAGL